MAHVGKSLRHVLRREPSDAELEHALMLYRQFYFEHIPTTPPSIRGDCRARRVFANAASLSSSPTVDDP